MKATDLNGRVLAMTLTAIVAGAFMLGTICGENYGRQREYWRVAAKCPAIVKEVPEK